MIIRTSLLVGTMMLVPGWSATRADDAPRDADGKPAPAQTILPVSKETTRITKPLDDEGFVDYVAAVNEIASRGVTPENNFEVVVRRVLGPEEILEEDRAAYFEKLGIDPLPVDGDYFVDYFDFAAWEPLSKEQRDALVDEHDRMLDRPWTAEDEPRGAKWLEAMDAHLDAIVEGSKRTHNYTPYLDTGFDDGEEYPALLAILLPSAQQYRQLARSLRMRAMLRVGDGDLPGAWQDVMATHRIARLSARGFSLIELLVGYAVDTMAQEATTVVLRSPRLSDELASRMLADLNALDGFPPLADKIDVGERFMGLDTVTALARSQDRDALRMLRMINALSDAREASGRRGRVYVSVQEAEKAEQDENERPENLRIDWGATAIVMNEWYDRLVTALRERDFRKQRTMLDAVTEDLKRLRANVTEPSQLLARLFAGKPREEVGRLFGEFLVTLLLPAFSNASVAESRTEARIEVMRLATAAEVFRRTTGSYPERLDDLVPRFAKRIPPDPFSGKPLVYEPSRRGFLIYSVGDNGRDDDGRTTDDRDSPEDEFDDIAVRVGTVR